MESGSRIAAPADDSVSCQPESPCCVVVFRRLGYSIRALEWNRLGRFSQQLLRFRTLLHILMVDALDQPVVFPADQGKYLVELRYGTGRAGYFVAKVFPGFVLILTFLFLTMEGTPEAKLLREKLGLHRKHIEEYHLDRFFTLTGSDIANDPLLSRVLAECGCGHLIALFEPESQSMWLDTFGERLKQGFGLREAEGGFKVGRKWMGWSDDNPFLDEATQDETEQD